MPTLTAAVSDGLMVRFVGSEITAACGGDTKSCAGFCVRAKDSTTGHAFCWFAVTNATVTKVNTALGMTVAKADFEL